MRIVLLSCLIVATAAPLAARDLYVDNELGSDRFNGGAARRVAGGGPVRTIGRALELCHKGDTIHLANTSQPYCESVSLSAGNHGGYPDRPLTIEGNGAILDGTTTVHDTAWQHSRGGVFRFRPLRTGSPLLYLDGKPAERRLADDVTADLEPRQWALDGGSIYFGCEEGRLPQDYALRQTGLPAGITLYHVRHVLIRDLIVQGFAIDGVSAADGVAAVTLTDLLARGNGRSGVNVAGSSRVDLERSVLGDNGTAQLRTEGHSITRLRDVILIDNTAPAVVRAGGRLLVDGKPYEEPPAEVPAAEEGDGAGAAAPAAAD